MSTAVLQSAVPPPQLFDSDDSTADSAEFEKPTTNAFGDSFRNYEDSKRQDIVRDTYYKMHTHQTLEFVREQKEKWLALNHGEFTVFEMIRMLDNLVDDSDPDNDSPNSIHDFQTAERIRKDWPDHDWFHLVGLLHDLGKVMALEDVAGKDKLEQWAVVGDTFPVGCAPTEGIVFGVESFVENPDIKHPVYGTKNGIYDVGCGIGNLEVSWSHDEYMYQVLKRNGCTIPEEGLAMIRLHSLYPWHNKREYTQFEAEGDEQLLKWVLEFNKYDLYSKADEVPNIEEITPYYMSLLEKYNISGKLKW